MKIKVKKSFSFAYDGVQIIHYAPGIHEVSKRCAEVALKEGWAVKPRKSPKKEVA